MNRTIVYVLAAALAAIAATVLGLYFFGQDPVKDANDMSRDLQTMPMPGAAPATGPKPDALPFAGRKLTVVSWGGAYTKSQIEAYHKPFAAKTGAEIASVDYDGGIAQIKTQVESGTQFWDVVDMEVADAALACGEGLLEKIDPAILPPAPDGTPAAEDFVPNAVTPCAVTTILFSHIVAYNSTAFPEGKRPTKLADFFDVAAFPGKRGLRKTSPKINLEMALRADGVAGADVYATLATPEGLARAFRKLDSIRPHVVWWEAGAQPPQLLADREVAMTTAYNGRIFDAKIAENQPFEIVWDGQIQELDVLAIVKGAKNADVARAFIAFATSTQPLAEQARYIAYGPARKSSLPLVGTHAATGIAMAPHMPNAPENSATAIQVDSAWWAERQEELNQKWAAWLARS
jgi:putative spermidine/putrescine transport system substrate-binding protein